MNPNKTAADVGRLLEVMGVDRVIAVDLERPGTGSGGAFLGPGIPVETLLTTNIFAEHIAEKILGKDKSHQRGVTVISVRERGREAARDEGREGNPEIVSRWRQGYLEEKGGIAKLPCATRRRGRVVYPGTL